MFWYFCTHFLILASISKILSFMPVWRFLWKEAFFAAMPSSFCLRSFMMEEACSPAIEFFIAMTFFLLLSYSPSSFFKLFDVSSPAFSMSFTALWRGSRWARILSSSFSLNRRHSTRPVRAACAALSSLSCSLRVSCCMSWRCRRSFSVSFSFMIPSWCMASRRSCRLLSLAFIIACSSSARRRPSSYSSCLFFSSSSCSLSVFTRRDPCSSLLLIVSCVWLATSCALCSSALSSARRPSSSLFLS
mmetsp:Transcript_18562/g.60938  ORF Transcript_18562/g.60938 Transcript_18562/m.60938 type:complete len:246 (-) Transcript_18562:2037-2774(-)